MRFRDAERRRRGRDGAGSVSLQSLKTVTSNKYGASEGVVWGGEEISVKNEYKSSKPLGGQRRGGKKRTEKEEDGMKWWWWGGLFLSVA